MMHLLACVVSIYAHAAYRADASSQLALTEVGLQSETKTDEENIELDDLEKPPPSFRSVFDAVSRRSVDHTAKGPKGSAVSLTPSRPPSATNKTENLAMCLVGNGPLSQDDRTFFASKQNCDTVVRFNDAKNLRQGERCDLHVVRAVKDGYWGTSHSHPAFPLQAPLFVIGGTGELPRGRNVYTRLMSAGNHVFDHCKGCKGCITDGATHPWLFQSGAYVLSFFQDHPMVGKIHTFGMNFKNDSPEHASFSAQDVRDCCSKCVVHKTYKMTYKPRRTSEMRSLHSDDVRHRKDNHVNIGTDSDREETIADPND